MPKVFYDQAVELEPSAICTVFLCDVLLQLDQADAATKLLTQVNRADLNEAEEVDYAFVLAALAIELESGNASTTQNLC